MKVEITRHLEKKLQGQDFDIQKLIDDFKKWKFGGASSEYDFYFFGKDGAYFNPPVNGVHNVLRHVHIPPTVDQKRIDRWKSNFKHKSRKTSNTALVYVRDNRHNYLLITILDPAHEDIEDDDLKEFLADVADSFIYYQDIIF